MFTEEDFQFGINAAGIHFMCRNTGAMFTLNKVSEDKVLITIRSKSAKQNIIMQLRDYLSKQISNAIFTNCDNIARCYIAPYLDFGLKLDGGQIALKHKKTGKSIFFGNGTNHGKSVLYFAHKEPLQNYDKVLIDFKNIFWKDVASFYVRYEDSLIRFQTYSSPEIISNYLFKKVTDIQRKKVLEKGVGFKVVPPLFGGKEPCSIKIYINENVALELCNFGLYWGIANSLSTEQPIRTAIYIAEILQKNPFVERVIFCYQTIESTSLKFEINKENFKSFLVELEKNYPISSEI
mgnify:CR=1 FL=1